MAELFTGLEPARIRANLDRIQTEIGAAARRADRDPADVELLVAAKYVPTDEFGALVEAGVELVGENRAQDLVARRERFGDRVSFDFIGQLQSRKVRDLVGHARLIHSVATESALRQLERHHDENTRVLIEVDVAGEATKSGIAPGELAGFLDRCPVPVDGLMTLPPPAARPDDSRPHFAALRELAARHGLERLSMGTSQDYAVAVEEGATVVRVGTIVFA